MDGGKPVEFVESVQPPIPREKKWVLIISALYGCPVGCPICDAGEYYQGKLSKEEIISQIDYMVTSRFPDRVVPIPKFKIQFARMGEPAFNENVLDILEELPELYDAPGLLPTLSTIAPKGTDGFFERLLEIKKKLYKDNFQLQFSIHTTDFEKRDWFIPAKKWGLKEIADYGERFYDVNGRKITLNFAMAENMPIDSDILRQHFDPQKFFIKITPINPTFQVSKNKIRSHITPDKEEYEIIDDLRDVGFEVLLSIGELEENNIGSNCGQFITNYLKENKPIDNGYTYLLQKPEI